MGAVLNLEGTWQSANIRNLPKIPRESECLGSRVRFWNSPGILSSGGRTGGSPAWSPPAQTWNTRKASSSGRGGGFRSWKRKNHAAIFLEAALPAAELSGSRSTIATGCRPRSGWGSSPVFSWSTFPFSRWKKKGVSTVPAKDRDDRAYRAGLLPPGDLSGDPEKEREGNGDLCGTNETPPILVFSRPVPTREKDSCQ